MILLDPEGAWPSSVSVWHPTAASQVAKNSGIVVSPQTLLMLGERNIGLSFDIYAPLVDE
jgi:hypothetical protein